MKSQELVVNRVWAGNSNVRRKKSLQSIALLLIKLVSDSEPVLRGTSNLIPIRTIAHVQATAGLQRHQSIKNRAELFIRPIPIGLRLRVEPSASTPEGNQSETYDRG